MHQPERRRQRSEDTLAALHLQLTYIREVTGLEALVLVESSGCLLASAGATPTCDELAAWAPLLATPTAVANDAIASRVAMFAIDVAVRPVAVLGDQVLLCGRGDAVTRGPALARAAQGCQRILGVA